MAHVLPSRDVRDLGGECLVRAQYVGTRASPSWLVYGADPGGSDICGTVAKNRSLRYDAWFHRKLIGTRDNLRDAISLLLEGSDRDLFEGRENAPGR